MKNVAAWAAKSLVGGRLCLDFVNTVAWRAADASEERLHSYDDLLDWGGVVGIVSPGDATVLRRLARQDPDEAARTLERARRLREALFRLFSSLRQGRRPQEPDLEILEAALAAAPPRRRLIWRHGAYAWDVESFGAGNRELERVLWPIVWSAADLLVEGTADRIKECAGEKCGWLFFDASRNRSRRWCSMRDCGNRAKVRRHYHRTRRQKGDHPGSRTASPPVSRKGSP